MVLFIGFGVIVCEISRVKILKKLSQEKKKKSSVLSSRVNIWLMVAQNPTIYFVQTVADFLLSSAENTKNKPFLTFY